MNADQLRPEIEFAASRSSGPGGQNVNKVNSRVTLRFDIVNSRVVTPEQKEVLLQRLSAHVSRDGLLSITVQETRSQSENKEIALKKLDDLLKVAFKKRRIRKATKPSKASKQERLKRKKVVSEKKKWRKRPDSAS